MRFDRFTIKSQEALQDAQRIAEARGNQELHTAHLLYALLSDEQGAACQILKSLGTNMESLREDLDREIDKFPKVSGATPLGQVYLSPGLKSAFEAAFREAGHLQDEYVSVEHLLLGAISDGGPVSDILKRHSVDRDSMLRAMQKIRGSQRVTDPNPEDKYQALKKFARDLTELARRGKLDPVIGRDEEIRRIIQVLSRRTKNNPVLIGEPGVGKTAIAEGLA
ncbi:MAG: Clp protease N-terminal domain-containing protein, partial [Thermodesulfovibrionales bacterium]